MKKTIKDSSRTFLAVFESEHDIVAATKTYRDLGYTIVESYTPYAVHGLDKIIGLRASRLPLVCLLFGLAGAAAKLWFQVWTSASSWPVNVGGKPLASVPAFVPVTFEITVLFAGVGTVVAFFLRSRLWPGKRTLPVHPRVTDDTFALLLLQDSAAFNVHDAIGTAKKHNAIHTEERVGDMS